MSINVTLLKSVGFTHQEKTKSILAKKSTKALSTEQNQKLENFEIQNGYGTATTVSISPGFQAKVTAIVNITVDSITEETFTEIIEEVKKSSRYTNNSEFREEVLSSEYTSAGSASSGFFGWLIGGSNDRYTNSTSNVTQTINEYNSGDSSDNITVANSIANILVKSISKVQVTASIEVTGQLLIPSPTIIAVESTVFSFTTEEGTISSVTLLNQSPLVPVDNQTGTVSSNTLAPGSSLTVTPIG